MCVSDDYLKNYIFKIHFLMNETVTREIEVTGRLKTLKITINYKINIKILMLFIGFLKLYFVFKYIPSSVFIHILIGSVN